VDPKVQGLKVIVDCPQPATYAGLSISLMQNYPLTVACHLLLNSLEDYVWQQSAAYVGSLRGLQHIKSAWHPFVQLFGTGDVDVVVFMLAGQTNFAMTLDLSLPMSGDRSEMTSWAGYVMTRRRPQMFFIMSWLSPICPVDRHHSAGTGHLLAPTIRLLTVSTGFSNLLSTYLERPFPQADDLIVVTILFGRFRTWKTQHCVNNAKTSSCDLLNLTVAISVSLVTFINIRI